LTGDALQWYKAYKYEKENATFEQIIDAFLKEYCTQDRQLMRDEQISEKTQKPNQTIQSHVHDIMRLALRQNKNMSETDKIVKCLKGMIPLYKQELKKKNISTWENFLTAVKKLDSIYYANSGTADKTQILEVNMVAANDRMSQLHEEIKGDGKSYWHTKNEDALRKYEELKEQKIVEQQRKTLEQKKADKESTGESDMEKTEVEKLTKRLEEMEVKMINTDTRGRDNFRGRGGDRGSGDRGGFRGGFRQDRDTRTLCYNCQKRGHFARDCRGAYVPRGNSNNYNRGYYNNRNQNDNAYRGDYNNDSRANNSNHRYGEQTPSWEQTRTFARMIMAADQAGSTDHRSGERQNTEEPRQSERRNPYYSAMAEPGNF
jgi:hypothetical protein